MSTYLELKQNPPVIKVDKENPREVHFAVVSCMCDNKHKLSFKRREDGSYAVTGNGEAISNFQMVGDVITDLEWAAEDGDWDKIVKIINSGTILVESVKYR